MRVTDKTALSRGASRLAPWLLAAMAGSNVACWTVRPTSRSAPDVSPADDRLATDLDARAATPEARATADGRLDPPSGDGGAGSAAAPTAPPDDIGGADDGPPPDKAQVEALLRRLLGSLEPSGRIQVLLVDDGDCFGSLARDPQATKALPAAVSLELGAEDSITSSEPSEAGLDALRAALATFRPPEGRRLVHTRLYGEVSQIGWTTLCVIAQPFLGRDDLLRQQDATSLTFGLTRAGEDRVRAHEPTDARLAFTIDGHLVLAVAPLDALRLQPEPLFTLYRQGGAAAATQR